MQAKYAHFVMINYYYPPMKSPGVTRNFNFSKSFEKVFKQVDIFTTYNRNILQQDNFELSTSIHVHEVKTYDYRTITAKSSQKDTIHFDDKKKQSFLAQIGIKLIDTFPFNILFGEGGMVYIVNAYITINRYLKQYPNTVIYTSFRPYSDLFIGYLLKKKYPDIKWVADFRDLHVEPIYKNVYWPRFQVWWNRRMLRKADVITSVSHGLIDQLRKYNRPSLAFFNGVTIRPQQDYFNKFTISYTGSLFKNERDPSLLFAVLQTMLRDGDIEPSSFQIVYAGKDGNRFEEMINTFELNSIFVNHHMVARDKALMIQSKSHLNLLLSVNSEGHKGVLTGKLFEYLGALNQVLLIMIGNRDDEFEKLFSSCDAGCIFYTENEKKDELRTYILNLFSSWKNENIAPPKMNVNIIEELFSWDNSVENLLGLLDIGVQ